MSLPSPKEFYERFKNDPEGARRAAFQLGQEIGRALKQRHHIQGEGIEAVAEIVNAGMRDLYGASPRVEGNRVIIRNTGFCAIMRAAMTLNIPWEWLDINFAWPLGEGVVSTIRPDIKMRTLEARHRRDAACVHVFEIE